MFYSYILLSKMDALNFIQKLTLVIYSANSLFSFLYSWYKRKRISLGSFETTILPLVVVLSLVSLLNFSYSSIYFSIIGLALYLIGFVVGAIAFSALGWTNVDDFWFSKNNTKKRYLVTKNLYRYVRHPLYTAMALSSFGLVLVFFHWLSISLWILAMIFVFITALNEEKFMQSKFPEYKEYMKRTGRFFPRLPIPSKQQSL